MSTCKIVSWADMPGPSQWDILTILPDAGARRETAVGAAPPPEPMGEPGRPRIAGVTR